MTTFRPYAPAIAWGIFIFVLSVWPGKDFPQLDWGDLLSVDKLVHITFYGLLTALVLRGYFRIENYSLRIENTDFGRINGVNKRQLLGISVYIALSCTLYGWVLEWFQENYCQDRLFDWFDGLANTIGAFLVLGLFIWQNRQLFNGARLGKFYKFP